MARVLHIQASPRGEASYSNRCAWAFLEAYREVRPEDVIETLDLASAPPVPFHGEAAMAKMAVMAGQEPDPAEARVWEHVVRTIDHFKKADKVLLSSPMWNFSVPYPLKHYIDVIIQPRETFRYTGPGQVEGLAGGRPMTLILARGGRYAEGSGHEALDRQKPYLALAFGFIGFEDIRSILIEPTASEGPEVAEQTLEKAVEEAREAAGAF